MAMASHELPTRQALGIWIGDFPRSGRCAIGSPSDYQSGSQTGCPVVSSATRGVARGASSAGADLAQLEAADS